MSLGWFGRALGGKLEVEVRARLCPDKTDFKSVRILNRIAAWCPDGIQNKAS